VSARVALALARALAACRTGRAMSVGQTEHQDRAPNMAAFLILANGHGRGILQWASANYASALLDTYAEWAVFEPARGRLMDDQQVLRDLIRRIERAAVSRDAIDIFIFAHDNDFWRLLYGLSPAASHKLRLVYNAGCDGAGQYRRWLEGGAHAYVGHPNDSCSQMFLYHFQTRWWAGMPLYEAVGEANYDTREMLLDRSDPFGMACRNGQPGELIFQRTAAQVAGDGSIRIDTPVR
jgi:hypothetical protein